MQKRPNRCFSLFCTLLTALFLISALPWRELQADAQTHSEYNCAPFTVVYDQTSSWDNTTQAQFTVTNSSTETVDGWSFEIVFFSGVALTNLWNAQNLSDENTSSNTLVIGNEVYNSLIGPRESVTFGMTIVGNEYAPVAPIAVYLETESQPEITSTPTPVEEETPFLYAVFAGSSETDLSICGWQSTITGDVYSGSNFVYQGSELYLDGTVRTVGTIQPSGWTTSMSGSEENAAPRQMPDWNDAIIAKASAMTALDALAFTSQNDIIINGYYQSDDSITIDCASFSGTVFIVADGDITINADTITGEGAVIFYSETGNITINSTNATINGILYAPVGRVSLSGNDITINGRTVANEFGYSGSTLTVTSTEDDLWFLEEYPDITPTEVPTITPTTVPTITPEPTATPTGEPTITERPTPSVTLTITPEPTSEPTAEPTSEPTTSDMPTISPTITQQPTIQPTEPITPTITADPTRVPTTEPTITETPTVTPVITDIPTPTVTETPSPTPYDDDYDLTDSDSDGLLDYVEDMLGTEIYNPDTDGDGLLDGDEMNVETNPFFTDRDMDGLSDFNEDYDCDGLTNGQEYGTNTCMFLYDTDFDGINDYDELNVYGTDPRNEDSDNDGIVDGDELVLGLTPNRMDSDGDGITDDYETFLQSLSLDITADDHPRSVTSVEISGLISGLITSNTTIEDTYSLDHYCTDVAGLVGVPINIESEGHFDSMTLTFHYDESELGETSEDDLGVLWFDDSTGFFVVQEQAQIDKNNNVITVELSHFSTYMLVDLNVWNNIDPIHYDFPDEEERRHFDIVFAVNYSNTMDSYERETVTEAIENILSDLEEGDRVGYSFFDGRGGGWIDIRPFNGQRTVTSLAAYYINTVAQRGPANLYYARSNAELAFEEASTNGNLNKKIFIVISDENVTFNYPGGGNLIFNTYAPEYYIMSIPGTSGGVMQSYAADNNGVYFPDCTQSDIPEIILQRESPSAIDLTLIDSDSDGLPDYIEEQGMIATNGRKLTSDPNDPDSDDDTLPDREEDNSIYTISRSADGRTLTILFDGVELFDSISGSIPESSQYYPLERYADYVSPGESCLVAFPSSDSALPDSDYDGFADYEDARPNVVNPDMVYVLSNPDFEDHAANKAHMYEESGYIVRHFKFSSIATFQSAWNRIGLYDDQYIKGDNRYYYNPQFVVIYSHGNSGGFCLGSESPTCDRMRTNNYSPNNPSFLYTSSSELSDKKIETLVLFCCFAGGYYSEGNNIAKDFLDCKEDIQQVIAPDSFLWNAGNYTYFADYNKIQYVSVPEYEELCDLRAMDDTKFRYINCNNIIDRVNVYGFLLFTRNNDPIDYFSSDVIYGTLYTRNDVYPYNHGILEFVPPVNEQLFSNMYNDPLINRGVI